jgi:dolichol-phosphate mannosyltransferase
MNLSLVIPLYNEEKNIPKLYKRLKKILKYKNIQLIFIDDNSVDDSSYILKKISKRDKKVLHILRKKNRDLTQSCIDGFLASKYQNILVMDCDLQHNPGEINLMVSKFLRYKADFVIGTRDFKKKHHGLSYVRSLASVTLTFVINIFLGKKLNDPMSGFFIFKKKNFYKVKKKLFGRGYKILFDMIYLSDDKIKIIEHNITLNKRNSGVSKMSSKTLIQIIIQILRLFFIRFFK